MLKYNNNFSPLLNKYHLKYNNNNLSCNFNNKFLLFLIILYKVMILIHKCINNILVHNNKVIFKAI